MTTANNYGSSDYAGVTESRPNAAAAGDYTSPSAAVASRHWPDAATFDDRGILGIGAAADPRAGSDYAGAIGSRPNVIAVENYGSSDAAVAARQWPDVTTFDDRGIHGVGGAVDPRVRSGYAEAPGGVQGRGLPAGGSAPQAVSPGAAAGGGVPHVISPGAAAGGGEPFTINPGAAVTASFGLPEPSQLEAWAASYFPELQSSPAEKSYSPAVVPGGGTDTDADADANAQADSKEVDNAVADSGSVPGFDVNPVRDDFPILNETLSNGKRLIWLDNGATTQKPRQVIDRISYYYQHENSNVHRGAHELAARSTDAYENARQTVADYLGAQSKDNIVFVRGTTEGINLVAQSYVKPLLRPGDEIILTILEHHANIVPWQMIAQETGAVIKVAPVDDSGQIILREYERLFSRNTKFVSATHVSNALGTITPVHELVRTAHSNGARILIDGAQSVAHIPVNMIDLDADFYVFSGHKIFAPTGIGAVYGKSDALESASPYQGGGNMIRDVTFERTVYNPAPSKFEAGTGNIADAVGLGAALDYVTKIGLPNISAYEHELLTYATRELGAIDGLRFIGTAREKASALSFVLENASVEEVGKHLSSHGIAVRAGHHCAQPILRRFGLEATVRPTIAFYNTPGEIDALVKAIWEIAK